jgi:hypothetical protein
MACFGEIVIAAAHQVIQESPDRSDTRILHGLLAGGPTRPDCQGCGAYQEVLRVLSQ